MKAKINFNNSEFEVDFSQPIDISIPLQANSNNLTAWYVDSPIIEPVKGDGFIGAVAQGGSVNFNNISFNPHGHGTHTECLGHITPTVHSINKNINTFMFNALLITVKPSLINGDSVIEEHQIPDLSNYEALVIRTLPNSDGKKSRQYSNTNPAFVDVDTMKKIVSANIKHLLIDTPSVDKENDEGKLAAHHIFWNVPNNPRMDCSITELIYVPNEIIDGQYLLNLQFAPFENDASPSKPILYNLK